MATQKSTTTKNPVAKNKTTAKKTTTNSSPKSPEVVVEESIQTTLEQVQVELNSIENDPEVIVNNAMSIDFADVSSSEELEEDTFEEPKETISNIEPTTTSVEEDRYYKNVSPYIHYVNDLGLMFYPSESKDLTLEKTQTINLSKDLKQSLRSGIIKQITRSEYEKEEKTQYLIR